MIYLFSTSLTGFSSLSQASTPHQICSLCIFISYRMEVKFLQQKPPRGQLNPHLDESCLTPKCQSLFNWKWLVPFHTIWKRIYLPCISPLLFMVSRFLQSHQEIAFLRFLSLKLLELLCYKQYNGKALQLD